MDPAPHSLVKDCCNGRSRFSLIIADFDNSFFASKAVICLRLSIGLEARSKEKKHSNENVLKENDSSCRITELKFLGISVLPVCMASVSVIASKMSTDGFNSPSWIILFLSS